MLEANNLVEEIKALFSEKLLLQVDSPETDLLETGTLDSVVLVDLLLHLEQQFGFSVPMEDLDLEGFRCIAKIAEMVGNAKSAALSLTA
jgi:acyl carrier protein